MTRKLRYRVDFLNGMLLSGLALTSISGLALLDRSIRASDSVFGAIFANMLIQTFVQMRLDQLQHEAAHYKLTSSRELNDFLGHFACSIPMLSSLKSYRSFHFAHHRYLGNFSLDPEVRYYGMQHYYYHAMSRARFASNVFLDLIGFHFVQFFCRSLIDDIKDNGYATITKIICCHLIFAIFVGFEIYALGWLLPMMTLKFALSKIQGYSEHIIYQRPTAATGHTVAVCGLVRFWLFPLNSHLHVVHHLVPHVPWVLLPERNQHYSRWTTIYGLWGHHGLFRRLVMADHSTGSARDLGNTSNDTSTHQLTQLGNNAGICQLSHDVRLDI